MAQRLGPSSSRRPTSRTVCRLRPSTPNPRRGTTSNRRCGAGARVFKVHLQVGDFDPRDRLSIRWGTADAAVPVVVHCGIGTAGGAFHRPRAHR